MKRPTNAVALLLVFLIGGLWAVLSRFVRWRQGARVAPALPKRET